jgi:enoyl-CoA hydratase/carnithine racemase
MYSSVKVDHVGATQDVVVVTLDRPERRNALDAATLCELHEIFDHIGGQIDIRAVIFTGCGEAFCAGLDLKPQHGDHGEPTTAAAKFAASARSFVGCSLAIQELMASLFEKIHRLRQPVIAAVNGPALGGGFAMALACDIRIIADAASFGAVFIHHGISACDMGTSYFLPRLVGASRSAELLLTGRVFDATEAERIGLVHLIDKSQDLLSVAVAKAREIASSSPLAVWMTKETMWQNLDAANLRQALDLENRTQVMCGASGDPERAFAAFREKRAWVWQPL